MMLRDLPKSSKNDKNPNPLFIRFSKQFKLAFDTLFKHPDPRFRWQVQSIHGVGPRRQGSRKIPKMTPKINENPPDKIWPKKKRDINFLVKKSILSGGIGYIKVSKISNPSKVKLSKMKFSSFGNDKKHQHYKDVLKFILYDLYAKTEEIRLKKLLKEIYKF